MKKNKIIYLAKTLGIEKWKVKYVLGLLCYKGAATTVEMAKEEYDKAFYREEKLIIFLHWDNLSLKEINEASTLEAVNIAYNAAPDDGNAWTIGFNKADQLALQEVEQIFTEIELEAVFFKCPEFGSAYRLVIQKLYLLALNGKE